MWAKSLAPVRKAIEAAALGDISASDVKQNGTKVIEARLGEVDATIKLLEQFKAKLGDGSAVDVAQHGAGGRPRSG